MLGTLSNHLSKRLNEMDELRDMGRVPLPVHAGATANVLLTILLTFLLRGRSEEAFTRRKVELLVIEYSGLQKE